jgi:hypothetical protein
MAGRLASREGGEVSSGESVNRSTFENGRDPPGLCANCGASRTEHLDRTCAEIREDTMPGCNSEVRGAQYVWLALYNPCTHESSAGVLSVHATKEGACRAIARHKNEQPKNPPDWEQWSVEKTRVKP